MIDMTQIIHKAKCLDSGEWVEGNLILNPKADNSFKAIIIPLEDAGEYTGGYYKNDLGFETWYKVDPESICRYTRLSDKNKKKIWENDIVKCYADTDDLGNDLYLFYKVTWNEKYHCWWLSDIYTLEDDYLHEYNPSDIEVIGNIFDNPELLGKSRKE